MAQYVGLPEGAEIVSAPPQQMYAGLPQGAKVVQQTEPHRDHSFLNTVAGTIQSVAAGVNSGAASLHRKMFGKRSTNFEDNAQWWRNKAAENGVGQDTLTGKVAEGAGTLPAALPEWLPTPAGIAVGTALNASGGYQEAKDKGENALWGAAKGAAKHLAFRGIFKVVEAIPVAKMLPETLSSTTKKVADVAAKSTLMGGTMAGETALEGGDAKDVAAAMILGTALPIMSHLKPEKVAIKDTLVDQGVPEEVATKFADASEKINKADPKNVETFNEAMDEAVKVSRRQEEVTSFHETPTTKEPEYVPYKFTPEERTQLDESISKVIKEDGTFDPEQAEGIINLTRVEGTDRQLAVHDEIAKSIQDKVKERLGEDSGKHEEITTKVNEEIIRRNSQDTGIDFLKTADKASLDLQRIAVESAMVRQVAAKYVKDVDRMAEIASKPDATEADKLLYYYYKDKAAQYVALDAEMARQQAWALNSRKIEATGEGVNLDDLTLEALQSNPALLEALREDVSKIGGLESVTELANKHLKANELSEKIKVVKEKNKPSILNSIMEMRGLDILSSVYGRTIDLVANTFRSPADVIDYTFGASISKLRGRNKQEAIKFAEVGARMIGDYQGLMEAVSKGQEAVKEFPDTKMQEFFKSPIDTLYHSIDSYERFIDDRGFMHGKTKAVLEGVGRKYIRSGYIKETWVGKAADAVLGGLGKTIGKEDSLRDVVWKLVDISGAAGRSLVYGTMKLTDLPSEYMGYNSEAYGLATREGLARGLEGQQLHEFVAEIVTRSQALRDDIKLPDHKDRLLVKEIHEKSMKSSLERTWKNELESPWAQQVEGFMNRTIPGKIGKLVANQFFSTTARLLRWNVQHSVLAPFMSKSMRESLQGLRGAQAQDLATGKILFGTLAQLVALELVMNGTFVATASQTNRKERRDAGILDAAISVNGKLYQVNRLDPYGTFLTSMGAAAYAWQQTPNDDNFAKMYAVTGALIDDSVGRSWMKSLFDLKNAVTDTSGKGLQKYLLNYGATLIPMGGVISSVRDMASGGEVKAADTMKERVLKIYNPSSLENEPDLYGKDRKTPDRFLGIQTSKPDMKSARMEIVRLGINLPEAPDVLSLDIPGSTFGHTMNPKDKRAYMKSLASDPINMEQRLQTIVNSHQYQSSTPDVQKVMLQEIVKASHQMAKGLLWKKPEVIESARNKADAIGHLYNDHTDQTWKGNWMQYLTGKQQREREIMNQHGLKKKE